MKKHKKAKQKRLAIDEWADGKNVMLAMYAQNLVLAADAVYESLILARKMTNYDGTDKLPSIDDWIQYYENYETVISGILGVGCDISYDERKPFVKPIYKRLEKALEYDYESIMPADTFRAMISDWQKFWQAVYKSHIEDIRKEIIKGKSIPKEMQSRFKEPDFIFFFRVILPCWFEYGSTPDKMLQLAYEGKPAEIEKLLSIDRRMRNAPKIQEIYDNACASGNKRLVDRIDKAVMKKPQRPLSRQKVNVTFAAFIYRMFTEWDRAFVSFAEECKKLEIIYDVEAMKQAISRSEIRKLFNAAMKDLDPNERYSDREPPWNPDLPDTDRALWEAIKGELGFWTDYGRIGDIVKRSET